MALKESTTEWGRCLSGREQWSKEQLKYTVFLARSGTRMKIFAIQWHYNLKVIILNFSLKWFNRLFTIWAMATCHPCVISVFFNELILNAITIHSQSRPGGKMTTTCLPNLIFFWRLFLHFCEYYSTYFHLILSCLTHIHCIFNDFVGF